jgi:hypothetical protein
MLHFRIFQRNYAPFRGGGNSCRTAAPHCPGQIGGQTEQIRGQHGWEHYRPNSLVLSRQAYSSETGESFWGGHGLSKPRASIN